MQVVHTQRPPQRSEGGGFIIRDILSGLNPKAIDPFLIWHELPRKHYGPGEMPGAPLHPHRGMHECPYNKEMTPDAGAADGGMRMKVRAGGVEKAGSMGVGDFELGKVGQGVEHEALVDGRWAGFLHFFQLWVNLPGARKMDPPHFQNVGAAAIPRVALATGCTAKVLHGEAGGKASPTRCDVPWMYLDLALEPGATLSHAPPAHMSTRLAYVYEGAAKLGPGGTELAAGTLAVLDGRGGEPVVAAGAEGCGLMFCAGAPIGEPIVQHGPFVMSSKAQIQECFEDFQQGRLCRKPVTYERYD